MPETKQAAAARAAKQGFKKSSLVKGQKGWYIAPHGVTGKWRNMYADLRDQGMPAERAAKITHSQMEGLNVMHEGNYQFIAFDLVEVPAVEDARLTYNAKENTLTGTCADLLKETRNGNLYDEELWQNVFESEDFRERVANGGIIGELGHPADRNETDLTKSAIVMKEQPIVRDGKLEAKFHLLDTEYGRKAKELLEAGINLGISSRGVVYGKEESK